MALRFLGGNKRVFQSISTRSYAKKPVKLKAKGHSSQEWLRRQMTDPYVEKARINNFRCRRWESIPLFLLILKCPPPQCLQIDRNRWQVQDIKARICCRWLWSCSRVVVPGGRAEMQFWWKCLRKASRNGHRNRFTPHLSIQGEVVFIGKQFHLIDLLPGRLIHQ